MPNETDTLEETLKVLSSAASTVIKPSSLDFVTLRHKDKPLKMAEANKSEIQMLLNAIPEYYPGQNLALFINEVDGLITHLNNTNKLTPDLSYIVNFSIRSKIKAEARDFIAHQGSVEWPDIRKSLLQKYGDQRSEDLLVSAVAQCVQKKSESYLDYYSRLLKAGNSLMQNISLHISDPGLLAYKKHEYSKLALKTFQNGILEPYRTYLSHFELPAIEDCLNKCRYLDNQKQEWDYCEFVRKSNETFIPKKAVDTFQKPTTNIFQQPIFQRPILNTPPRQPFLSAAPKPFPIQQHQNFKPYNNPFQNQRFSQPNFRPSGPKFGSGTFKALPPPEPMSIQSRVRSQNVPNKPFWQPKPSQNFFQQNQGQKKPNFLFEELTNMESEQPSLEPETCSNYNYQPTPQEYVEFEYPSEQYYYDENQYTDLEDNGQYSQASYPKEQETNFQVPASDKDQT